MTDPLTVSLAAVTAGLAVPPAVKAIIDMHHDATEAGFRVTFRAKILFSQQARKEVAQVNLRRTIENIKASLLAGLDDIPENQVPRLVGGLNGLIDFHNKVVTGRYSLQSHAQQRKLIKKSLKSGETLQDMVEDASNRGNIERMNKDAKALFPSMPNTVYPDNTLAHFEIPSTHYGIEGEINEPQNGRSTSAEDSFHSSDLSSSNPGDLTDQGNDSATQSALNSVNNAFANVPALNIPGLHPVAGFAQGSSTASSTSDALEANGQIRIDTDGRDLTITSKSFLFKYSPTVGN